MTDETPEIRFARAKSAAREIARLTSGQKADLLVAIAERLVAESPRVVAANAEDLDRGRANGIGDSLLDRLALSTERVSALADATRDVASLPDPVGQVVRGERLPNGLRLEQVRVPFGVVGAIYEARPNVTVDIAALALRAGNAVVLRGGSAAISSNTALVSIMRDALASCGIDPEAIQTVDEFGRDGANAMMTARGLIDVLVPRGSANLIETVVTNSTVPVIETGAGNVHVVLDASATDEMARDITVNSKTHRPSVCNSAESVLVVREAAERLVPGVVTALQQAGVTVHGDDTVMALADDVVPATEHDWQAEYLTLDIAMRVVDTLDDAIDHISRYSTHHTETIVTSDLESAERFLAEVDSAAVYVNASTRFTDGGEFGFGAEVGISTQKLHARGPMGLPELTSTKWIGRGSGQARA
ncbi:MAG: glutamate-5-semialdehyde dehydrogenase [Candidatus Microbacterium stercoravium]